MAFPISEQIMWVVQQATLQTAGPQAAAILTAAGLERFLTAQLDPASSRPVATGAELSTLYHTIYQMLGEDLTRLFQRHCGEITVAALLQMRQTTGLQAQAAHVPPARQVRWFADAFAAWTSQTWAPMRVTEDAVACYLELVDCYACAGITGAKRPICASGDVIYGRLARAILSRRVHVVEVECVAVGGAHCKFGLYK